MGQPEKLIDTEFFGWSCKTFEESVVTEFCTQGLPDSSHMQQEVCLYRLQVHITVTYRI